MTAPAPPPPDPTTLTPKVPGALRTRTEREELQERLDRLRADASSFVVGVAVSCVGGPILVYTVMQSMPLPIVLRAALWLLVLLGLGFGAASMPRVLERLPWLLRRDSMTLPPDVVRRAAIAREDLPMSVAQFLRRLELPPDEAARALELVRLTGFVVVHDDRVERDW